jgi:hypothetical membrane protein
MKKALYWVGIITPLIYTAAVILGGTLWHGYNHLTQAISELSMESAPNRGLMDTLFGIYGWLLLIDGAGFACRWRKAGNKLLAASGIVLMLCSLSGLLMGLFRQDPIDAALTFTGSMHLILAGAASLSTILAIFLAAAGFQRLEYAASLSRFSLVLGIIVLVSGGFTAAGTTQFPSIFGMLERITIGSFMLWLLVCSAFLLDRDRI